MKLARRLGLTTKFNFLTISLILATSLGIAIFVTLRDRSSNYENLVRKGMTTAAILAQNSEYGIYTEDRAGLRQIAESLDADADVAFVAMMNKDMHVLVSNKINERAELPTYFGARPTSPQSTDFRNEKDGREYIAILAPVISQPRGGPDALFPGSEGPADPGSREQGEVAVPGEHEPRDPNADERRPRDDRAPARNRARRPSAEVCAHDPVLGGQSADRDQRHPRLLEGRGRFG